MLAPPTLVSHVAAMLGYLTLVCVLALQWLGCSLAIMDPAKRDIPIKMGDFSVIDSEFNSIRERFDAEMKKMEDEMNRFRSELISRESPFSQRSCLTSSKKSSIYKSESSNQSKGKHDPHVSQRSYMRSESVTRGTDKATASSSTYNQEKINCSQSVGTSVGEGSQGIRKRSFGDGVSSGKSAAFSDKQGSTSSEDINGGNTDGTKEQMHQQSSSFRSCGSFISSTSPSSLASPQANFGAAPSLRPLSSSSFPSMLTQHSAFNTSTTQQQQQQQQISQQQSGFKGLGGADPKTWLDDINSPLIQNEGDQKQLKLRFDVSQYKPEEIVVKTVDNKLMVHAKHEEKSETRSVYREYNREFLLPQGTNPELIKSSLSKDGVLTVEAPLPALGGTETRLPITQK